MEKHQKEVSSQALKFSVINYIGAAIGIVSTLFIYPNDKEFLGIMRYIFDGSQILMAFFVFGTSQSLVNYFPRFKDSAEKRNIFFSTTVGIVLINSILFSIIFLLLANSLSSVLPDFHAFDYIGYSIIVGFAFAMMDVSKRQASNYQKIAIPTVLERFSIKLFFPVIFLLLLGGVITVETGKIIYTICFVILFIIALLYVKKVANIQFNFKYKKVFDRPFRKEYLKYSIFAFFSILGSLLAFKIDGIMVPNLIEGASAMTANGTYSIGVVLAATLAIPAIGLYTIYSPIITEYIAKDDIASLGKKYKEVSMLLFALGGFLLCCIFLGVDDLFSILPTRENLIDTIPIILILSFNVVIDMSTGFNSHILLYSKYYRFNMFAIAILVVLNVSLNVYFIKYLNWGIEGAAYATLISMTLYNSVKLIFIYSKYKIQPFTKKHFLLLLAFIGSVSLLHNIPTTNSVILNIILKVGSCMLFNGFVIYKLRMIPMLNDWISKKIGAK
ncbi:polysaccharide biosynthesis C-terminal domain-containing protein [Kordia sp. YSTF-M3]|uniref:Polysaccharide biosynthesis C-terminal domain-containing protein n=1 Tax=Kordia aestuariivivens TaxID=2759037 RepID=A0ABR7QAW1_9FLAO|nr:polysaccharide biosynthesis C-terminal domain-containing protein [Kordia aestuariivivens]MBC8755710.1 polysaccharide biosynthesis C-terminal domain-containing protein [Kordia aestuariivivens]